MCSSWSPLLGLSGAQGLDASELARRTMELRLVLGIPEDCCRRETGMKMAYFISHTQGLSRTRADHIEELQRQQQHQCLLHHPYHSYPLQNARLLHHHMLQDPCHASLLHNIIQLQLLHIWTGLGLQLSKMNMIVQLKLQFIPHINIPGQPTVWSQQGLLFSFWYQQLVCSASELRKWEL